MAFTLALYLASLLAFIIQSLPKFESLKIQMHLCENYVVLVWFTLHGIRLGSVGFILSSFLSA